MLNILLILLVLLMFIAFFEDYISERDRLWLFIGAAAVMALVAGFRPDNVDKDYDNYIRFYYSFDITTEYTLPTATAPLSSCCASIVWMPYRQTIIII